MKKFLLGIAILSIAACSKFNPFPIRKGHGNEVTWRFVVYDSNSRVVDSTAELYFPDSAEVTMVGPNAISTIPPLAPHDTIYWIKAASFFMVIGPATILPGFTIIPVSSGGCAFRSAFLYPSLDRSGWMLQRTENGKRINMFAQIQDNGYDGKYNDFLYPVYIDGVPYPNGAEQDFHNQSWVCGSTQGSCTLSESF